MTLHEVLKNTGYDLSLFSEEARRFVENEIFVKTLRGKDKPFITCLKRNKEIALKPEETVRQLYLYKLIHEYGYPASRIYKDVIFDTHPVAGKMYKNSENRRKQGVSCGLRCSCRYSISLTSGHPGHGCSRCRSS